MVLQPERDSFTSYQQINENGKKKFAADKLKRFNRSTSRVAWTLICDDETDETLFCIVLKTIYRFIAFSHQKKN